MRDARDWRALCGVIGRDDLGADASLAAVEGRRARESEIDAAIAAWTATRDHIHAANELQAVGVPAAPVMPNWEIVSDNHLNGRGFFVPISHPEAGTHSWPGWPWRFARTPGAVYRHAPRFAEHNAAVFGDLLGLDVAAVGRLYSEGVTSDAPVFAAGPGL